MGEVGDDDGGFVLEEAALELALAGLDGATRALASFTSLRSLGDVDEVQMPARGSSELGLISAGDWR